MPADSSSTTDLLNFPRPLATVDVVILTLGASGLRVLLVQRPAGAGEPFPKAWALPGGFVDVQQDAALTAQPCDRPHVLDHAEFVVHVHQRHEHRVRFQRLLHLRGRDDAVGAGPQPGDPETLALETPAGVQHGPMLGARGHDVTAAIAVAAPGPSLARRATVSA